MFSLNSSQRYYLYGTPTDMRKSFDGLSGIVTNELGRHPAFGDVYVFVNKRRDRIKLLHLEPGGFVLYYKRLEKGRLTLPKNTSKSHAVTWSDLVLIIEGIDTTQVKRKRRYLPTPKSA
ncbi:IS66 family insertion sequence element accessory protein TnpB [Limnospira sp. Paracas R14]|uniref:IS66 family insertion sequence element accessory protein TnpB n=1 Tax=Limnospira sp. Paracas R14 TaxID=2981108 RepID=UPI0028EECE64